MPPPNPAARTRVTAENPRSTLRFPALVAVIVVAGLLGTSAARANLNVNFTRSLPIGIYRRVGGAPFRGDLVRGDLVVACLPKRAGEFARGRRYLWRGDCPGGAAPV